MNYLSKIRAFFLLLLVGLEVCWADNQTPDVSLILSEQNLPFSVSLEQIAFQLPEGNHSGVFGQYKGLWIFIAGSNRGLHGFGSNPFPSEGFNKTIYIVNPLTGQTTSRSLSDISSGLTQQEIESLAVVSPQSFQKGNTLYMAGGYGVNTLTGQFETKAFFTAINLPGIVNWVMQPNSASSVKANIKQVYNPVFQITGGEMFQTGETISLMFGQNFTGVYTPGSNGNYSEQIRQFKIYDNGSGLTVQVLNSKPFNPNPNYRRRDLNILPVLLNDNNLLKNAFVAYSGVFTESNGIWTVPVVINEQGEPSMANPNLPTTFKQGMNNYVSAAAGLYSTKYASMYTIFFGGISYGSFNNGVFVTDNEIPFTNQVTTVKIDRNNNFTQYIMNNQYPAIYVPGSNPPVPYLFGAGAYFINSNAVRAYPNKVLSLDGIRKPTVIGYIVGGIKSTLNNTNNSELDTSASPYIFKVTLIPK